MKRKVLFTFTASKKCGCGCAHAKDYGACDLFQAGMNGRCVYCDHGEECHPGSAPYHNGPLGPVPRAQNVHHWNSVLEKLDQLYQLHGTSVKVGAELDDLINAVGELVAAYDRWLE
jgi:hypothetical protein